MEKRLFVDVHVIQTVPPSCVNRDDTGSPKTAVYGGVRRARVSSQSWKRAMRSCFRDTFDESELGVRTLKVVEMVSKEIRAIDSLISSEDADVRAKKALTLVEVIGKQKDKENKNKKDADDSPENQNVKALFFITRKQAENLAKLIHSGEADEKGVKDALNGNIGVDIALFGRMAANNISLNVDASAQVAHSISTHKVDNEYDYYTAVDEMTRDENAGAGMIGTIEFNSSTLYRYATVAVHELRRQLGGDPEDTAKAVREFTRAFIVSMPTGKQNTFANRTLPSSVFVSVRGDQPINLVTAFESPLFSNGKSEGYAVESAKRLAKHELEIRNTFAPAPIITWQVGIGLEDLGQPVNLQTALDGLEKCIRES